MPATPYDAKGLLVTAIRDDNPVIFIEHKKLYNMTGEVPGKDITIISNSYMTLVAIESAKLLEKEHGINCEVLDLRSISPLDKESIINSAKKTSKIVVLYEACRQGGIGAEIISIIQEEAFDFLDSPVLRICGPDNPVPFCSDLEDLFIPGKDQICKKILNHFKI